MGKLSDCQRNSIDGIEIGEKSVCYVVLKKRRRLIHSLDYLLPYSVTVIYTMYVHVGLSNMRMNLHYSLNRLHNISFLALHTCSK